MPVDHPGLAPVAVRRAPPRLLVLALSFLVTLAVLLVFSPFVDLGRFLS
ncbi:hypothetical protein [Devosia sp. CN2-171]|jgi:hypothetical protein